MGTRGREAMEGTKRNNYNNLNNKDLVKWKKKTRNSHNFVRFCKTSSCWSTPSTHIPYWLTVLASHVVSP